eukprot:5300987-Pleurochrysis_carterae.AAC.1
MQHCVLSMMELRLESPEMASRWTLLHVKRVPVYLESLLKQVSARGTLRACSSGTTASLPLRWPLESQPSADRRWYCPAFARKQLQAPMQSRLDPRSPSRQDSAAPMQEPRRFRPAVGLCLGESVDPPNQ